MQALPQVYTDSRLKQELEEWALEGAPAEPNESPASKKTNKSTPSDPTSEPNESPTPTSTVRTAAKRSKQLVERRASRPQPAPRPRRALPEPEAVPEPVEVPEPTQDQGPVSSRYAHGVAMKATLDAVCMRPDLSSKAKFLAVILASHYPTIRPSRERLMALTGLSRAGVWRGLDELRQEYLLEWKRGSAHAANLYTCRWLEH